MLTLILGEASIGVIMLMLGVDLVVFSSLIVILILISREGGLRAGTFRVVAGGLMRNPMIVAIVAGFAWSGLGLPVPAPMDEFLLILGAAATPGALFAIGASLASKTTERMEVAVWLSFAKLVLHPAAVALFLLVLVPVDPFSAAVAIAAAGMPVAGNIYILARGYGVAPQRVSASILVSTAASIVTLTVIIGWVAP